MYVAALKSQWWVEEGVVCEWGVSRRRGGHFMHVFSVGGDANLMSIERNGPVDGEECIVSLVLGGESQ